MKWVFFSLFVERESSFTYSDRVENSPGWLDRPSALRGGEAKLRGNKAEPFDFVFSREIGS